MTLELIQEQTKKQQRFWSIAQINLAAAFGGLVPGCYLLGRNFRMLGRPREAKITYVLGILGTLLLILIMSFIPDKILDRIPNMVFMLVNIAILSSAASYYQEEVLKETKSQGGKRYSYWWCLLMIFTINVIQVPAFFTLAFLLGWMIG
jgi:hypothetical protein